MEKDESENKSNEAGQWLAEFVCCAARLCCVSVRVIENKREEREGEEQPFDRACDLNSVESGVQKVF